MVLVIIVLFVGLFITASFVFLGLSEVRAMRNLEYSVKSYYVAEGGLEDLLIRSVAGYQMPPSPSTLNVGSGVATRTITVLPGGINEYTAKGNVSNRIRVLRIRRSQASDDVQFFYGVQVGSGGLSMGNNAVVNGNVFSNGAIQGDNGAAITGDAIAASSNEIRNMRVGDETIGDARAGGFPQTSVHGSNCPNIYCIIENVAFENLPISSATIQKWKDIAAAGGTCVPPQCDASGNFKITNGESATLGPIRITGNLEVDNNAILTVRGTIWVLGEIKFFNNCVVRLDASYGPFSGLLVSDNKVDVSNGCEFSGSGDPASHIMLLSDKNSPSEEVIKNDNVSLGVIYYAGTGRIKFSNNSTAKEATAYGITLDNNAVITYESGLANARFSSGPSGGTDFVWEETY